MVDLAALLAALATGIAVAAVARVIVAPTRRLADRVRPYTVPARTALGRPPDVPATGPGSATRSDGARGLAARLLAGRDDEALLRRLRQADLLTGVAPEDRVAALRMRELGATLAGGGIGAGLTLALPVGLAPAALLVALGVVAGASRWRARIDRAIEERRTRMRIELYTINHLLALDVRVGGGVLQAVRRMTERGRGVVVDQLGEVLRLHESGVKAREAFVRVAQSSPEPSVARTLRLLGAAAEHGADLAEALLEHSEDVREARRQALVRAATRRRAAMLVPVVGVLAPVMLLFVGAPLTSLIFGVS